MINQKIKYKLFFSLMGFGFPLLIAVFTIPWLIHHMGVENFGVLTLAWVLVGFAGVFDFGLGKSFTSEVARRTMEQQEGALWRTFVVVLQALAMIGLFIFLLFYLTMPWIMDILTWQDTTNTSAQEQAIAVLLYAIPAVIMTSVFVGLLEGVGAIKRLNTIRLLSSSLVFLLPLVAWYVTASLLWVMLSLVLLRISSLLVYGVACWPKLKHWYRVRSQQWPINARDLFVSGGWMSVSAILAPLLTSFDRFAVGSVLSVSVVPYYATPTDMLMKLQVLSAALMSVLFPAFAASVTIDSARLQLLFFRGALLLFSAMLSVAVLVTLFAESLLRLWLDDTFAIQSSEVLRWAAIGLVVNAMSFVPFGLLQAMGRADLTAKVNLIELPFYLGLLYVGLTEFGIVGAAVVSTIRLSMNSLVLFALTARLMPELKPNVVKLSVLMMIAVVLLMMLGQV
ncbi:MAG TPA: MATE family efflux transporter [Thiotrichales bacterium]|nr:MATE family efflux transporter [Thiotrichales bacterium]